jgi:hypothetical protein
MLRATIMPYSVDGAGLGLLRRDVPPFQALRLVADAAVAVFSAEVDQGGDDPRQVMAAAAMRVARQRDDSAG